MAKRLSLSCIQLPIFHAVVGVWNTFGTQRPPRHNRQSLGPGSPVKSWPIRAMIFAAIQNSHIFPASDMGDLGGVKSIPTKVIVPDPHLRPQTHSNEPKCIETQEFDGGLNPPDTDSTLTSFSAKYHDGGTQSFFFSAANWFH